MLRRRGILAGATALASPALGLPRLAVGQSRTITGHSEAPTLDDQPAKGWSRDVLIRWGDPVLPGAPNFEPYRPSIAAAEAQFGWDAIIAGVVSPPPTPDGVRRLVLVAAHPDVWPRMAFPNERRDPRISGKMQGVSIINLSHRGGRWVTVYGGYQSRRITDGTLCRLTGPATNALGHSVQGVLAPGIGCVTPWGTVLVPEGNASAWIQQLGDSMPWFAKPGAGFRFGWVVEIDALNPLSFPAKRTALGRFPRSGVACGVARDGTPVVFMTEARPFGRLFRFKGALLPGSPVNALDVGVLSVARVDEDGITWYDLPDGLPSLTATDSVARQGSRFDAPGGMVISHEGQVFMACTGNRGRGKDQIDRLNPRAGNGDGHIVVFTPSGGDLGNRHFAGRVILLGGRRRGEGADAYPLASTVWLRKPRTLSVDATGAIYVGTDQRGAADEFANGLFRLSIADNGQAAGLAEVYRVPVGSALGGSASDYVSRTVFAAVRHPGATRDASFANPATRWPTFRRAMPPQTTVVTLSVPE